jgi:hypothetical protein
MRWAELFLCRFSAFPTPRNTTLPLRSAVQLMVDGKVMRSGLAEQYWTWLETGSSGALCWCRPASVASPVRIVISVE